VTVFELPQQVTKRFRQLTTAAGLPGCRLHDLRHLSASLQLAAGVNIAVVSKSLEHSALSFTCDTYCHLIGKAGRQAADKDRGAGGPQSDQSRARP
jgi:site-specific recombinase XerD